LDDKSIIIENIFTVSWISSMHIISALFINHIVGTR